MKMLRRPVAPPMTPTPEMDVELKARLLSYVVSQHDDDGRFVPHDDLAGLGVSELLAVRRHIALRLLLTNPAYLTLSPSTYFLQRLEQVEQLLTERLKRG